MSPDLVLASASPRRQEILARLGIPFRVQPVEVDESVLPGEAPETTSWRLALAKADATGRAVREGVMVGADTAVSFAGEAMGKPGGPQEAEAMLRRLRDREHTVVTGVVILDLGERRGFVSTVQTRVWMRHYDEGEIAAYVASGEPFDKAGGYAIQSEIFRPVDRIEGCYLNVVGLPLCEVVKGLREIGFPLPPQSALEEACRECPAHAQWWGPTGRRGTDSAP